MTDVVLQVGRGVLGVVLAAVVVAAACGRAEAPVSAGDGPAEEREQRWSATGSVIAPDGGPVMFCASWDGSLPPHCGMGVPVAGVDLDTLPGVERVRGVTFSEAVLLVGRWDGEVFHVTEPPSSPPPPRDLDTSRFDPPCPEPAGGWPGAETTDGEFWFGAPVEEVQAYAEQHAEVVGGLWVQEPLGVVTVTFTDDLDAHRVALASHGDGVCVQPAEYSRPQLRRAATVADGALTRAGHVVMASGIDEVANRGFVELLVATDNAEAVLDDRGLSAMVRLGAWLKPHFDDPAPANATVSIEELLRPWADTAGEPVLVEFDEGGGEFRLSVQRGPEHCGWDQAVFLRLVVPLGNSLPFERALESHRYVRDPHGVVLADPAAQQALAVEVEMPADARASGYSNGTWELWLSEPELEEFIYLKHGDYAERWPRSEGYVCD